MKELVGETVVCCLEGGRGDGREAAAEAYVFVAVEIRSVVDLIDVVVFWIS